MRYLMYCYVHDKVSLKHTNVIDKFSKIFWKKIHLILNLVLLNKSILWTTTISEIYNFDDSIW